ncbi:HNH endonuclease [Spirosoma pomorum]
MIQLTNIELDEEIADSLKLLQEEINILPSFEEQSDFAKTSFSNRNRKGNVVFDEVKKALTKMCAGARRCVYCEDSVADEVEHIYPKDIYPGKAFDWDNYVYACGPCNGPKNNKFAVFREDTGTFQRVNPPPRTPAVQPPIGDSVLINPRTEDPLDYCMLDLSGTFKFVITKQKETRDYQRAEYTFDEVLRLRVCWGISFGNTRRYAVA